MSNNDGLVSAFVSQEMNTIIKFKGGFFSFAFGSEIALVLDDLSGYYILNCDSSLFDEVKTKVNLGLSKKELISFWLEKSKTFEVSKWSNSFCILEGAKK